MDRLQALSEPAMDNQSVTPSPDPDYILGSKRRDRVVGILIGIGWWVIGGLLMGVPKIGAGLDVLPTSIPRMVRVLG